MCDNWDDDDFEPETAAFTRPVEPEPIKPIEKKQEAPKEKVKKPVKAPAFAMESLGRELNEAEKEAIQKKNELALAREMMGCDGEDEDANTYSDISTKQEFEYWGEKVGGFLATRNKATHYGDMIGKLLIAITENLTPADIQKMTTLLQQISTSKKTEEKKTKAAQLAAASTSKKNQKASLKVTKATNNTYDDYDAADDYDDYDDY